MKENVDVWNCSICCLWKLTDRFASLQRSLQTHLGWDHWEWIPATSCWADHNSSSAQTSARKRPLRCQFVCTLLFFFLIINSLIYFLSELLKHFQLTWLASAGTPGHSWRCGMAGWGLCLPAPLSQLCRGTLGLLRSLLLITKHS